MIPAIPTEGEPFVFPVDTTCCPQVFDYANALLEWVWTGIAECIGSDDSPCGAMVRYVSWGPPIIRPTQPNVLAVYTSGVTNRRPDLKALALEDITFGVELWEGCYPLPDDNLNGPTYYQFHEANRIAYAHGMALWSRLLQGASEGFSDIFTGCRDQRVLSMVPLDLGAPGVSVGWRALLSVTW